MDVLASAAVLEAMDISAEHSGGMAAGAPDGNVEHAAALTAAARWSAVPLNSESDQRAFKRLANIKISPEPQEQQGNFPIWHLGSQPDGHVSVTCLRYRCVRKRASKPSAR